MKHITILGANYEIIESKDECDKSNADGLCNYYNKKIYVRPISDTFVNDQTATDECRQNRYNEVMRHEIIHAFLDECGLDNYSKDEELVSVLAMQFYKLYEIFNKLDV